MSGNLETIVHLEQNRLPLAVWDLGHEIISFIFPIGVALMPTHLADWDFLGGQAGQYDVDQTLTPGEDHEPVPSGTATAAPCWYSWTWMTLPMVVT
jgi:hypothetical protein